MTQHQTKFFTPLKHSPKPHKIAAFDTEGNGDPKGFVCASVVSDLGEQLFTTRRDTLEYLFSRELRDYWIFAHNLEYDIGVLTGGDLRPFKVLFAGSNLLWVEKATSDRHKWRLMDSLNILPHTTIKELGLMVNLGKLEPHPLIMEHLKLGRPLNQLQPLDQRRVLDYCLRDSQILYKALMTIQDLLNSLGGELRPTVSGCAMDLYRRRFMDKVWPVVDPAINRVARIAYFGARTEPYVLGRTEGVNGYDISSLYPSVMAKANFPHPGYLVLDHEVSSLNSILKYEGVSQCTVIVPDVDPPVLPGRVSSHLFFPTGKMTQAWPHNELRFALERGVKIENVEWSLWSRYSFSPFGEFIDKLYSERVLAASQQPIIAHFFKLLLNSSYGRFGVNAEDGLTELVPLASNSDWPKVQGGTLKFLNNWPYALKGMDEPRQPAYANSLIASYITAEARIKMHSLIERNLGGLIYTDTDSLWTSSTIETGQGLGELRQIEQDRTFWCIAPKEYAVFSGEYLTEAHAKGVPEQQRMFFLQAGFAAFDSPVGLREGLRHNIQPSTWITRYREKRYALPKRPPASLFDLAGERLTTRPWNYQELLRAFQSEKAPDPVRAERRSVKVRHLLAKVGLDQD